MKKLFIATNLILTILFAFVILFHPNTAFDQDLGRHIKIGEIIAKTRHIPDTNLFTYTNTNFPFINHHWLGEVIFYQVDAYFGKVAISYLKIAIFLISIMTILFTAYKMSSFTALIISAILYIPLLMERTQERPEMFGLLFFSIFLLVFLHLSKKNIRWLIIIPIIQILWVNIHITFIYGLFTIFLFTLLNIKKSPKTYITLSIASIVATLINPHFLEGAIYPFKVFANYGYTIVENMNLFYLSTLTSNIFITYFWIISSITFILIAISLIKNPKDISLTYIILFITFYIVSIQMLRNFPFFVFVGIICTAYFLEKILSKYERYYKYILPITSVILLLYISQIVSDNFYKTFDYQKTFGLSVRENYKSAANFYIKNKISGPIFNNFDIGGYLDYRLYPDTKTYIDNRPEAFPISFFDEYKMQYDSGYIMQIFNKNKINSIIFAHTDGTQWGIEFLKRIKEFPEYKMIYLDAYVVIYEKNSNHPIVDDKYINALIKNTNDSYDLLNLFKYLRTPNIIEKAYRINPDSCQTRLYYGYLLGQNSNIYLQSKAREILKSTWKCPFPQEVKNQIANL